MLHYPLNILFLRMSSDSMGISYAAYQTAFIWSVRCLRFGKCFFAEHSLFVRGCLFGKPVFKVSFVVESYLGFSILKSHEAWISIFHRGK